MKGRRNQNLLEAVDEAFSAKLDLASGDVLGIVFLVTGSPESDDSIREYLLRHYTNPFFGRSSPRSWISRGLGYVRTTRSMARVKRQYKRLEAVRH